MHVLNSPLAIDLGGVACMGLKMGVRPWFHSSEINYLNLLGVARMVADKQLINWIEFTFLYQGPAWFAYAF